MLVLKNIKIIPHKFKKKIYIYPISNIRDSWGIHKQLKLIRPANTYTRRGLLTNNKVFFSRTGRISGYV